MKEKTFKTFEQHGFVQEGEIGDQAYGNCIFCGKEKGHFYINKETYQFDCKSCGITGGFQTFLQEVVKHCQQFFKQRTAINLSKNRQIKISTLKEAGIGYNPKTGCYILPILKMDGKGIEDIRIYKLDGKFISTKGCHVGLFGWENLKSDTIWLCEGEWDAMVMREILKEAKIEQNVLAVPGANTFKGEWVNIFRDKIIFILYDNDEVGQQGAIKVYNTLNAVTNSLMFLCWSSNYEDGFDVRDFYKLKGIETLISLTSLMEPFPKGIKESVVEEIKYQGKGIHPNQVYSQYQKWLKFPKDDTTVLDVIFGTIIANRLKGEPLWLFVVAPSGGMKSELLMTLFESTEIFSASTITPHALISGANFGGGGDPSLIPKLNGKVFIIKDFTVILSMNINDREEIFAILRDCYDGHAEKQFGNGIFRSYKSKFGLIAGVTPKIDEYTETHVALGERFIRYKIPISHDLDERMSMISKALSNVTNEEKMRSDLSNLAIKILDFDFGEIPIISSEMEQKITGLAMWTSLLRSVITRDRYTREVLYYASEELGTRLAKQFKKLLLGIALFRRLDKVGESEYKIIKNIASNTIPIRIERIISQIFSRNPTASYTDLEIAEMISLPGGTTKRLVENLHMLDVMRKEILSSIKIKWTLSEKILRLIEASEVYKE